MNPRSLNLSIIHFHNEFNGCDVPLQVGPALSALDADVSFQSGAVQRVKDYKSAAQHSAAAQEARAMLGALYIFSGLLRLLGSNHELHSHLS